VVNLIFRFSAVAAVISSAALLLQAELLKGQELNHSLALAQTFRPQKEMTTDTIHVLAIMVQFQTETDGLMSGDGHLLMGDSTGLDAPPHDKTYFENHLLFLKNYFRKVSGGELNVSYTVLDSVITLPHQMKYYSPPKSDSGNNLGLLFQDSWHAADSIYGYVFPFSNYKCFAIFHAGSGKDIDFTTELGYDPLPYDIPSVYLGPKSLEEMFGVDYRGQSVDNGNFHIDNSIIMPEWEDFPVISLRLGINGLLAASFGSSQGLPDLFDTQTGITGIGRFGLMDGQSIFAYGGIFPPEPSAWEKAYLGWTAPVEVSPPTATQYKLYANETGKYSILKVPISPTEYFLLENREGDALHDGENVTSVYKGDTTKTLITLSNESTYFDGQQISKINGVVTDADEFDWALPQDTIYFGGVLIWHIDESVIDQNIASNTINANPAHRGVALMEAIGASEIGDLFQSVFGSYYYDGSPYDFWYAGNPDRSSAQNVGGNSFTPTSLPNSDGYSGANSHIYITNFSGHDSLMSFYVTADSVASNFRVTSGFPKDIYGATVNSSPVFGHISVDDSLQVIANNGDSLYVFNVDGRSAGFDSTGFFSKVGGRFQPVVSSSSSGDTLYAMDDSVFYGMVDNAGTEKTIFETKLPLSSMQAGTPMTMTGEKLAVLTADGYNLPVFSSNGNYMGDQLFHAAIPQRIASFTSESGNLQALAAIDTGTLYVSSRAGIALVDLSDLNQVTASPGVVPIGSNPFVPLSISYASLSSGTTPFLIEVGTRSVYVDSLGAPAKTIFTAFPGDTIISGPVIADLDGDGNRDIIFATQTKIYAISYTGAALNHFPISTVGSEVLSPDADRIVGSIVVADLDGDGKLEVIFGTKGGTLYAFTGATGQVFPGFPISIGGGLAGSPAVAYDSQTGKLYLAAIGLDGYLYSWTFKGTSSNQVVWGNLLHDNSHMNSITTPLQSVQPPPFDMSNLMPKSQVYNWPNPVTGGTTKIHFYLRDNAQVSISIFSFAGHKVADMQTTGAGGVANEIDWNAGGVQSGVYFARIEAISSKTNERDVAIIKIAVVK